MGVWDMVASLLESREYKIFDVFMRCDNWVKAKAELMNFGAFNPRAKIIKSTKDNEVYCGVFNKFKEMRKSLFKNDEIPSLDNMDVLNKIAKEWKELTIRESHKVLKPDTNSVVMMQCNIGKMISSYADSVIKRGKDSVAHIYALENKRETKHEVAMTDRSGNVRHGGFSRDSVISKKRGSYWNRYP